MTRDTNDKANDTLYLYSYALRHIYNNRDLFSDMCTKNYEFITAGGEIIWSPSGNFFGRLECPKWI